MMSSSFLDTNPFLRHLRQDDPVRSPRATAFFERIERGEIQVRISDLVILEIVFTLQRGYKQSKQAIQNALLPLIELPGIVLPGKRRYRRIFDLYVRQNISFADAYHAVLMQQLKISNVVSFDADFDRIAGITRSEP